MVQEILRADALTGADEKYMKDSGRIARGL